MRSLSIPDSTRPVRRDVGGCADIPAKLTLQGRQKILDVILCFHPLKEWQRDGEWDKGGTEKQVQGMQDPDCAEPGTVFFLPCDLSTAELSDTSSAVLTRRCRALIEVGLSHPCSPMILFSMGQ